MTTNSDRPTPTAWARFRFSVVGSLLSSPPAHGELKAALEALAGKTWNASGPRTRGAFLGGHHRAPVLQGPAREGRPGGRAATGPAQGLWQGLAAAAAGRTPVCAVQSAQALDLPVALRQPGRGGQGRPFAGDARFVLHRPAVHAGPRHGPQAAGRPRALPARSARPGGGKSGRSAATRRSTSARCGTSTSTTARSRCSRPAASGRSRWPWASSTTARGSAATCSGICRKPPRT